MDWRKGFSALYYASFVDVNTWRSIEKFEFTGGNIKATGKGLRESADIDCMNFTYGERWVRIYLVARQGDDIETVPLFTGLSSCPDDDIDGFRVKNKVELYSVLKPCEDVLLPRGYYVPYGIDGGRAIKKLLSVTPAPVVIDDEPPVLSSYIVAEDGESNLSMAEKILSAINWRYRIDGDGTIHVQPYSSEPVASYDPINNDCLENDIKKTYDWYQCPNVFRAVDDGASAVARDDSPDSPFSTVNRGREIWMEETSCNLNDYIPIDSTMTFTWKMNDWYTLGLYDASKNPVRAYETHTIADSTGNDVATGTLDSSRIPSTAKYVVLTGNPYSLSSNTLSLIRTA